MLPTREKAEQLLLEAEKNNPGAWIAHSRHVARCAERIAFECKELDSNKAYICGLLHDIGRNFGIMQMGHIYYGWKYMLELGYDEIARICLSHSFSIQRIEDYIGKFDISKEQLEELENAMLAMQFDTYDLLIQLCDSIAGAEGVTTIEDRMGDVKRRYGAYPQDKWDRNIEIMHFFEDKIHKNVYDVVK